MKKKIFTLTGMVVLTFLLITGLCYSQEPRFAKETGAGAINYTLTDAGPLGWYLKSVRLHLNVAGGAGSLIIRLNSASGSVYDVVLLTRDMTLVKDLVWEPEEDGGLWLATGDAIDIVYSNANSRVYGLEVEWGQR